MTGVQGREPITFDEKLVGFAELQFIDNQNNIIFITRGYTIRVKVFDDMPKLIVNAPAYKSGFQ